MIGVFDAAPSDAQPNDAAATKGSISDTPATDLTWVRGLTTAVGAEPVEPDAVVAGQAGSTRAGSLDVATPSSRCAASPQPALLQRGSRRSTPFSVQRPRCFADLITDVFGEVTVERSLLTAGKIVARGYDVEGQCSVVLVSRERAPRRHRLRPHGERDAHRRRPATASLRL